MDSEGLKIDFWDVGQGDCSVITLPDGDFVAIDVGPVGSPLIDWLSDRGPCTFKAVVLTHNHADHIGALHAIVGLPQVRIDVIYMVVDPNPKTETFQRIMRPVRDAVQKGRFRALLLTAGQTIWTTGDGSVALKVGFPDVLGAMDATTRNETSGILTLELQGRTGVVWPGDAMLADIDTVVKSGTGEPVVLDGPHHGAPQDFKAKDAVTLQRMARIGPRRCFVSVGSWNRWEHPNRKYLKSLAKADCLVSCSQLTERCQKDVTERTQPVLPSHGHLGLRAPRTGVACRGAMRFTVTKGTLAVDEWDKEHRERLQSRVPNRACALRD